MRIKCEFCPILFYPRPQVKNPRACDKKCCQEKRQRANEREWHENNRDKYSGEDFKKWRLERIAALDKIRQNLSKALEVGLRFLGISDLSVDLCSELLQRFITGLGIRRVNKLWLPD